MYKYQIFLRNENIELHTKGSKIKFHAIDNISFHHQYLSPGQTIATWSTMDQFWVLNRQNFLPRLLAKQEYNLHLFYESEPEHRLYVKLTFYNQYKEQITQIVLKKSQSTFVVPDETIHYSIELLNGGLHSFIFKQILLYPVEKNSNTKLIESEDLTVESFINPNETSDTLNIVFTEPRLACIHQVDFSEIRHVKNIIQISNSKALAHFYLNEGKIDERIVAIIKQLLESYVVGKVVFIGYGPISNFASQLYAKLMAEVPVEVYLARHPNVHYPTVYQKIIGYDQLQKWLKRDELPVLDKMSIYFYGTHINNTFLPDVNVEKLLRLCPALEK